MSRPSDAELVSRAQRGETPAFEALVGRHAAGVYRIALRMLDDAGDAEDAAQDAFVQAWKRLDSFRGDSSFGTWMYRVITNRCLSILRRRRPVDALPPDVRATGPGPEQLAEVNSQVEALGGALRTLTPEQRAPFVLREFEGCSYEQIAEVLDISPQAVKSRLHRARVELLQAMGGWR